MSRSLRPLYLLAATSLTSSVWAQEPGGGPQSGTTATPATSASASAEVKRDPAGVQGISPFWEAVNKGDASFIAQDFVAAGDHYQGAIILDAQNPIGHLRMAEAMLKMDELTRAEEFITAALRFSTTVIRHKAQASFLLAELRERQNANDDALDSWRSYKLIDGQLPAAAPEPVGKGPLPPKVYVESADKRTAAIETAKQLEADYATVRERIKAKIEEAEKAATGKK